MMDEFAGLLPGRQVGPILYLQGSDDTWLHLSSLVVTTLSAAAPVLLTADGPAPAAVALECGGLRVHRFAFRLPMRADAWYEVNGTRYAVHAAVEGDLRIAFVSCNGQEAGDDHRDRGERNAMWRRLAGQHAARPFQLLLHGGDQIYADELLDVHPLVRRWSDDGSSDLPSGTEAPAEVAHLLRQGFVERYLDVLSQPETAALMATVPSLAMWDDHDICDGWGSIQVEKLDDPVGRTLFDVARECFLLFQLGSDPREIPQMCADRTGTSLGWHVRLPQLHIVAPDLRSERRPDVVLGTTGWQALERSLAAIDRGRVLVISSVPALGPRLSWVEAVLHLVPRLQKYEDDLRDQWQSRAHRTEWRKLLETLAAVHADPATPVTLLSGEIHLATRATFDVPPRPMHQLVASGISHPAPSPLYAFVLDALARFGETPIPGRRIRLFPLPGKQAIYAAQRNFLVLERRDGDWTTYWELEADGATPPLSI